MMGRWKNKKNANGVNDYCQQPICRLGAETLPFG